MVSVKKCQSKKHAMGGCGSPRCPEGMSIQAALDHAVNNHDLNSFLKAKDMENVQPTFLSIEKGMLMMSLGDEQTGDYAQFIFPADRPEVAEHVSAIDKTIIPSFDSVDDMEDYLNDTYYPYAKVSLIEYDETRSFLNSGRGLRGLTVADMGVDADLRGMGVGRHMRATILKFADENNYVVTGTPTESGDGTVEKTVENQEVYKENCLAHKARLEKFYLDSGYEYNYAFAPSGKNYWTDEPYPRNDEWEKKLHPAAANLLRNSGFYIRWPNNTIPDNWKA